MPTSNVGERWEMDLIGPILDKKDEPKYIATGIDVFSREAWAKVIGHKTGKSIIKSLREAIAEHGRPKIILSDDGREFKNQEAEDFCKKEGITIKHGSPYSPTTTGAIERLNQTLMRKIRMPSEFGKHLWTKIVGKAVRAYNASPSRATGCAPCELLGTEVSVPTAEKYGIQKTTQTEKLKEAVQEKIRVYQQTYDKPLQNQEMFEIGTLVWYADPLKKRSKLDPKWSGLATIIGMGFESYKILCKNGKQVIANGRLLKRVEGSFDAGECCNQ